MVHRDPETGQFMTHDDEEIDLVYTDHEFLNFNVIVVENGDPGTRRTVELQVENDVLDLENDELGELGWMTARLTAIGEFQDDSAGAAEAGDTVVQATVGSNLSGTEYLHTTDSRSGVEEQRSDDGILGVGSANDDPGIWAQLSCTAASQTFAPDQSAAGGLNGDDRLVRRFHQETMGGPYIDASDDVSVGVSVNKERNEEDIQVNVQGQMAFIVYEYEHRRAEFAPYGPGPTV
jgi:hypothetical protein